MYLEDVYIEGFKSFSERTEMSFQPGIGVIIGSNGVGKSNILDAIVWAMGENDLAKLRCVEQDELFFSGSKDYPSADKIRTELNFKESEDEDSPAIQLVREMTRNGRESYWVGEKSISFEKYLEELNNLDIPHALQSIIRQEQINDVIMMNPKERFDWAENFLSANGKQDVVHVFESTIGPLFSHYLSFLFPRGEGELKILDQNGQKGLDIEVVLPGDRTRRAHQLSGGEKSVTSLALKLAIFEQIASPFYLLDEVEPALDYTNHKSMQTLLKTLAEHKQLIMITHLRSTIELAHTVHGVRTRRDGSSFMKFYFLMDAQLLKLYKCC